MEEQKTFFEQIKKGGGGWRKPGHGYWLPNTNHICLVHQAENMVLDYDDSCFIANHGDFNLNFNLVHASSDVPLL